MKLKDPKSLCDSHTNTKFWMADNPLVLYAYNLAGVQGLLKRWGQKYQLHFYLVVVLWEPMLNLYFSEGWPLAHRYSDMIYKIKVTEDLTAKVFHLQWGFAHKRVINSCFIVVESHIPIFFQVHQTHIFLSCTLAQIWEEDWIFIFPYFWHVFCPMMWGCD